MLEETTVRTFMLLPALACMPGMVSRLWRAVLLVPLAALLLGGAAAAASDPPQGKALYTSTFSYLPLLNDMDVAPRSGEYPVPVLTTPAIAMQKGETRRIMGQLDFRMPGGHDNPEVGNQIECFDQEGREVPNGSAGSGSNYTGSGGAFQWNVSYLLVAEVTENYYCELQTYVNVPDPNGWHMTVLAPAQGQTTYGTWLQYSSSSEAGGQSWEYGIGKCNPDGGAGCAYVGGPARLHNPIAIDVFTGDIFSATDDATTIDGLVTFMITTCTSGSKSCPSKPDEHGDSGVRDGKGFTWLEMDQLNPNGTVCQAGTRVYSEVPGSKILLSENYDISDAQHHRPLYFHVSEPVSHLCGGSLMFSIDLHIQWTADNGVKIDGGEVNVIDSVRATKATVPDVIGLSQAQAVSAITAAGLYTPAPNNVASTAAVGSVLTQDPAGGTTVPDGSPVQITVSLGQTTVPDVIGDQWDAAVEAITSAGLKAVASQPIINCTDQRKLGTVASQSPPAKAQVSPGSAVSVQLITCPR